MQVFLVDFLSLFCSDILAYLDTNSLVFLNKEVFTDVVSGEKHEVDLVAQGKILGKPSYFIVHIENESSKKKVNKQPFGRRMFHYFSRLLDTYNVPIYPIVVFSYDAPKLVEPNSYKVGLPDFEVLSFNYRVVQLNVLQWRDFLNKQNPIASALMSKMAIEPKDRPKVKLECLRMLATLKLDRAKMHLISGFVDTYLKLTAAENEVFQQELAEIEPKEEKEQVMQIVTSWMKEGIQVGEQTVILRLLKKRLGTIKSEVSSQVEQLSLAMLEELTETLLDFKSESDLVTWLKAHKEEKAQ